MLTFVQEVEGFKKQKLERAILGWMPYQVRDSCSVWLYFFLIMVLLAFQFVSHSMLGTVMFLLIILTPILVLLA